MTELNDGLFYCKSKAHIYDNEKDASLCCNGYVRINNLAGEKEWIHVSQLKDSVRENLEAQGLLGGKRIKTDSEERKIAGLMRYHDFRRKKKEVLSALKENKKLTFNQLAKRIKGLTKEDLAKIIDSLRDGRNN